MKRLTPVERMRNVLRAGQRAPDRTAVSVSFNQKRPRSLSASELVARERDNGLKRTSSLPPNDLAFAYYA
jgi:hypothetical protein